MSQAESERLARTLDRLTRLVLRRTAPLRGMSFTSITTLSNLVRTGPRRLTELAVEEGVTQPSMTTLIAKLAMAGLVTRTPDPADRRAVLIDVTEQGRSVIAQRGDARIGFLAELIDGLDTEDQQVLLQAAGALGRLAESPNIAEALAAARARSAGQTGQPMPSA
ncbi:MAG: MarR family winged helix-turn-helix transcriptional regulator [Sciscionella sp.]